MNECPDFRHSISLTGDRPTGPLHLGHYVGSLKTRLSLQDICAEQFIMLADLQAMVNENINMSTIRSYINEVVKDYISVGLNPDKNVIFMQSKITPLHEIITYYNTLITLSHLHHNPTIRQEMEDKAAYASTHQHFVGNNDHSMSINMHFLLHPVSQAADITAFNADIVPVGHDQLPLIHLANDIVDKFNAKFGQTLKKFNAKSGQTLKNVKPILSNTPRLSGIDGRAKASKSLNNAIFLSDTTDIVKKKVHSMYTDPNHVHVSQPGKIEGNVVFEYLTAFYPDQEHIDELKQNYTKGGLGDMFLKNMLFKTLEDFLGPIRERRAQVTDDHVSAILNAGSQKAFDIAQSTLERIKDSMLF